jgi:glycosyltransferase involved in cell wall biosynthesis
MQVDLYTMAYNEEALIEHMIKHYQQRFPSININVYDNESTDNTALIAKELGCKVESIQTCQEVRDDILREFKNNIWKTSTADWIIVCDVDEWVDIDEHTIEKYSKYGYFKSEGWDMIGPVTTKYGVRDVMYDKICVFRGDTKEINYEPGAHVAFIKTLSLQAPINPKLYHYRYLSKKDLIKRYSDLAARVSDVNKKNGWTSQYQMSKKLLEDLYDSLDSKKIKIR